LRVIFLELILCYSIGVIDIKYAYQKIVNARSIDLIEFFITLLLGPNC